MVAKDREPWRKILTEASNRSVLSVPDDLVHGFRPVTDKRDVAICIIRKTEIDIYSLSHFTE